MKDNFIILKSINKSYIHNFKINLINNNYHRTKINKYALVSFTQK